MIEINGNELQFMTIYIGIGWFEFGSGVTRYHGLVGFNVTFWLFFRLQTLTVYITIRIWDIVIMAMNILRQTFWEGAQTDMVKVIHAW